MSEESRKPEPQLPHELKLLESRLSSLSPTPALDRDKIVFESGRAAGLASQQGQTARRQRLLVWTTAALLLISLMTTALWIHQRGITQTVVENPRQGDMAPRVPDEQQVQNESAPEADELSAEFTFVSSAVQDYFKLRDKVLEEGADAVPAPASQGNRRPTPTSGGWRGI